MGRNGVDPLEKPSKLSMDGNVDFSREPLRVLVEGGTDAEMSVETGAQRWERNPERITHRNYYRSRAWGTQAGTMGLRISMSGEGGYFPSHLEPCRRSEEALLGDGSAIPQAESADQRSR